MEARLAQPRGPAGALEGLGAEGNEGEGWALAPAAVVRGPAALPGFVYCERFDYIMRGKGEKVGRPEKG